MESDQVLDEYRNGDADKRMSLFLYYRDLRDEFNRIEQDDPLDLFDVRQPQHVHQGLFRSFVIMLRAHLNHPESRSEFSRTGR